MKIPFRHGLVRYQTDISNNPTFLQKINGGQNISLIVSPQPTILTISHRSTDYAFQERISVTSAWGTFTAGPDYWIYWDIDLITGVRTFGHTTLQPIVSSTAPIAPLIGQHWYDTTERIMKVWSGTTWQDSLRVFAAKYESGSVLQPYPVGTQVGNYNPTFAGFILFDDEEKPIRRFGKGRRAEFIHSESLISTQAAAGLTNITFESSFNIVQASESIPEFYLVTQIGGVNKIGVAKHTDVNRVAVGLSMENLVSGQYASYASKGFISNETWNFSLPQNTPLFVGPNGEVTTAVPQSGFFQQVGHVVDNKTIYLDIKQPIFYENA